MQRAQLWINWNSPNPTAEWLTFLEAATISGIL